MKRLQLFLLFCLLLSACTDKSEDTPPILVTDIVMPDPTFVFTPGDKVTVKAQGFLPDDDIMLKSLWPESAAPDGEAYSIECGIVTEKTTTSITFLAPGRHPASTVEVLLRRSGEMMSMGKISVADGQMPKEPQLYGITNIHSGTGHSNSIEHIDLATGAVKEVVQLTDKSDFSCIVTTPTAWSLFGIQTQNGKHHLCQLDLSIRHWTEVESEFILTMGMLTERTISTIYQDPKDERSLILILSDQQANTRDYYRPTTLRYELPEGMKPESLSHYPCVADNGYFLLSADNGNGTFTPVVLGATSGNNKIYTGKPIEATRLIPFWTVVPVEKDGATRYQRRTGYAVVLPDNGQTELRLLDPTTMTLQEAFATFPNPARSIATLANSIDSRKLYVLFDTNRDGRLIYHYDMKSGEWENVPGIGYPYSEIALTW